MAKRKPTPKRVLKKPSPRRRAAASAGGELVIRVKSPGRDLEALYGAAYLMIDRAFVRLSPDGPRGLKVCLLPKKDRGPAALSALRAAFDAEFKAQKLRWAIARNNREIREYVAENALTLAAEFAARPAAAPAPAADVLTDDQRSEIERLIAEVETEIKTMNDRREHAEAKDASLSWEAARAEGGEKPE
jgi:His-Xaa-Ser system protein HxsD